MKQKILSLLMLLVLLAQLLLPVSAEAPFAQDAKVCSGYWADDTLQLFVYSAQEEPESQEFSLLVNNFAVQEAYPQKPDDAGVSIHYVLLIDTSTSMFANRYRIPYLVHGLLSAQQDVKISVARFGSQFSLVASDLTQKEDVNNVLNSLAYTNEDSDIAGSVADAIEALGKDGYSEEGEMTNLIVITDGEPWYSYDGQTEKEMEQQANEQARRMLAAYPEIVIHTFSFKDWNSDLQELLSDNRGMHGTKSTSDMGSLLAEYTDSLYSLKFHLRGYEDIEQISDEMMLSAGRLILSCGAIRNAGIAPSVDQPTEPSEPAEETTVPVTEPLPTEEPPEETQPETTEPEIPSEPQGSEEPSEPVNTESTDPTETTSPVIDPPKPDPEKPFIPFWVWICIGCVAVALLILLILKNRVPRGAVRMRLELVAGGNVRLNNVYYLDREILIGAGRNCDIVIPGMPRGSSTARIFSQNHIIFLEDIGVSDGILLNGMRIFSSNRLRSGDEITIGTVTLRVLF